MGGRGRILDPAVRGGDVTGGDLWFFERFAGAYELFMPRAGSEPLERGLSLARRPVDRVVDVAGGTGRAARAVDVPERVVVDAAGGMLRAVPDGLEPVRGDASRLPLRHGSVDAVLVVDALHHLRRADAVVDEAMRVLRPGGVLVVREFDRGTLRGRLVEAVEHVVGFDSAFFTADELARRLDDAGFEVRVTDRGFGCTVVGVKPGGP